MLPAMKNDLLAIEEYLAPGPEPIPIPITACRGEKDIFVPEDMVKAVCLLACIYSYAISSVALRRTPFPFL